MKQTDETVIRRLARSWKLPIRSVVDVGPYGEVGGNRYAMIGLANNEVRIFKVHYDGRARRVTFRRVLACDGFRLSGAAFALVP